MENHDELLEQPRPELNQDEPDWQRPDNRFIPLRATDLAQLLVEHANDFGLKPESLEKTLQQIQQRIEDETLELRREIDNEYSRFDPDRETRSLQDLEQLRTEDAYNILFDRLNHLLDKANFEKLTDIQIEQAIRKAKSRRINVRVQSDKVVHLDIWVRGRGTITQRKLTWRHPIAGVERNAKIFKRMAVVAQLKDDPHVMVKLFKDIPESDVESLLPHAQATMTLLDRFKLFGSGAGALGATLFKIFSIAFSFAAIGKLIWILLIGLITLLARTFSGYQHVRKTRRGLRVQHLYFQNLSNNFSAIQLVLSMVKQEELKEAFLGYAFACKLGSCKQPVGPEQLNDEIESFLETHVETTVDFDIDDAIETLVRLEFIGNEQDLRIKSPFPLGTNAKPHIKSNQTSLACEPENP